MFLNHYMHHIVNDIKPNQKGIFKKDPYRQNDDYEIDPEKALKDFKVFTFSCRSGLTKKHLLVGILLMNQIWAINRRD